MLNNYEEEPDRLFEYQEKGHHGHRAPGWQREKYICINEKHWCTNAFKEHKIHTKHICNHAHMHWHTKCMHPRLCLSLVGVKKEKEAYSAVYDCWERQIIKNVCTIPPRIGISILPLALVIKTIYLAGWNYTTCIRSIMLSSKFLKAIERVCINITISVVKKIIGVESWNKDYTV